MGEKLLSQSEAKCAAEEGEGGSKDCRQNKQPQEEMKQRCRQHGILKTTC